MSIYVYFSSFIKMTALLEYLIGKFLDTAKNNELRYGCVCVCCEHIYVCVCVLHCMAQNFDNGKSNKNGRMKQVKLTNWLQALQEIYFKRKIWCCTNHLPFIIFVKTFYR